MAVLSEPLGAAVEAGLLRALAEAWNTLNENYFKGALRRPQLVLVDNAARLGEWRSGSRTIALQRAFVFDQAWGVVVEVLKHEVAHQYVSEMLGDPDGGPHGPSFRAICDRLGIDGRTSGVPAAGVGPAPAEAEARILGRVAKLLALAESANRHEAEAAMARAQELMLKHNLEAPSSIGARRGYGFRHLGAPTGRTTEAARSWM